jgi:hypothetical protein
MADPARAAATSGSFMKRIAWATAGVNDDDTRTYGWEPRSLQETENGGGKTDPSRRRDRPIPLARRRVHGHDHLGVLRIRPAGRRSTCVSYASRHVPRSSTAYSPRRTTPCRCRMEEEKRSSFREWERGSFSGYQIIR